MKSNFTRGDLILLGVIATVPLLAHIFTNGNYGMFRDEFYYLACADRLAWGYVDHPPLSIAVLAAVRAVIGDSVHAIRIVPAVLGAFLVFLAGILAGELGGRRSAQVLAAVCTMIVPQYLAIGGFYSMNVIDLVVWSLSFFLMIRIIKTGRPNLWILLGAVLGLGLMNKISILVFGLSLGVALLATPHRRWLLRPQPWIGAILAQVIFLPHLLWQVANGWPTLEFIANAKRDKILEMSPVDFFLNQILDIHPLNLPVWLIGLGALLFWRPLRPFRLFGLLYLFAFGFFVAQNSKPYYLGPAYPVLLAAGAVALEVMLERSGWRFAKEAVLVVLLVWGALIAPLAIPILPIEKFIAYQEFLGLAPSTQERHQMGTLPQHFADRFGWENMAETVATVYRRLPDEQQAEAVIFTSNYGEAGALEYYRHRYGLPPAISGHNNYWLWGPGQATGNVLISINVPPEVLERKFETVTPAEVIESPYAMPYETGLTVYVSTGIDTPLRETWERAKHFN